MAPFTKMAVMCMYGKHLRIFLLRNQESFVAVSCYILCTCNIGNKWSTKFCPNNDTKLAFGLFIARTNLLPDMKKM